MYISSDNNLYFMEYLDEVTTLFTFYKLTFLFNYDKFNDNP